MPYSFIRFFYAFTFGLDLQLPRLTEIVHNDMI